MAGIGIGICLGISFGISGSLIFSKKDKDKWWYNFKFAGQVAIMEMKRNGWEESVLVWTAIYAADEKYCSGSCYSGRWKAVLLCSGVWNLTGKIVLDGDDYIYESIGHLVGWCFFRGEMEVAGCIWYRMGFWELWRAIQENITGRVRSLPEAEWRMSSGRRRLWRVPDIFPGSAEPHWGQTPLLLWEIFGRFLFLCLKFEKSLYNLNTMEKVFIRF